jgi:hypothetical protein
LSTRVNWYGDQLSAEIAGDANRVLLALAHQIEGQTKVNITDNGQVETGFLRSSIYVSGGGESSYSSVQASGNYPSSKSGESVPREIAPAIQPEQDTVIVAAGAAYAIHQELRNSFLYRALEQVAAQQPEGSIQIVRAS